MGDQAREIESGSRARQIGAISYLAANQFHPSLGWDDTLAHAILQIIIIILALSYSVDLAPLKQSGHSNISHTVVDTKDPLYLMNGRMAIKLIM